MTAPGDYLEFQEGEPIRRMLEKMPEVRKAIQDLYSSAPNSLVVLGKLRKGAVTVSGRIYTFLLLRHGGTKVSILTVTVGELSAADVEYFRCGFK